VLFLIFACDSRQSGATEESVLASFREFYLHAAEVNLLKTKSLQHLDSLQKQNSDTYRTIAYTWNNQSLKECTNKQTDTERKKILSDYDRFVEKEKSNFHVQEIDDAIRPCIRDFYINYWQQINKMILFNLQIKK
jgi:hypothetical protein